MSVSRDKSIEYTHGNNTASYLYTTAGTCENEKINADSVKYNNTAVLSSSYTYDDNGNVLTKSYGENNSIVNTYDIKDRITSTAYAGKTYNYTYDINSQLTAVSGNNYSASYTYDSRGNITSKTVNGVTTSFTYANSGWKDLLVSVDDTELEYDANGNVLLYGDREFTWTYGRSLASIIDGNNEYCYTYNEDGIRTSKTVNGVTTYFNTKDGVILSQTDETNNWYFQYDTNGTPLGFVLNGVQYFYITNQMNDVLAITDTSGTIVGNYEYDAWGKVLTADTSLAQQNPLRYRGYYYDNETGYYYLQSRYYDSSICRFINADIAEISQMSKDIHVGTNLFAYCNNDSVNNSDPTGKFSFKAVVSLLRSFSNLLKFYISKILNKIMNRVGIYRYKTYFQVRSSLIASFINGVSNLISGVKTIIVEFPKKFVKIGIIQIIKLYAKSSEQKFKSFIKKEIIPNLINILWPIAVKALAFLAAKIAIKNIVINSAQKIISNILKSKNLYLVNTIVNIFSSTGNMIAFVMDCFDGNYDGWITVRRKA